MSYIILNFFLRRKITKSNNSIYEYNIGAIPIILFSANRKLVNRSYNFFMVAAVELLPLRSGRLAVEEYKNRQRTIKYK